MAMSTPALMSFGRRLALLADLHPDQPAIIFVRRDGQERRLSWRALERASNQLARLRAAHGADQRSTIVVGLPNCPEHYIATFAVWKLGALLLALRSAMPDRERDAVLDLAQPAIVIADWSGTSYPTLGRADLSRAQAYDEGPLPDRIGLTSGVPDRQFRRERDRLTAIAAYAAGTSLGGRRGAPARYPAIHGLAHSAWWRTGHRAGGQSPSVGTAEPP